MKNLFFWLAAMFLCWSLPAQTGTSHIKFAGLQYDIPKGWEVDPFGSYRPEDWDEDGSSVCECTGVIHISPEQDLFMVFYPSLPEGVDLPRRQQIWDYQYIPVAPMPFKHAGQVAFTKQVSAFEAHPEWIVERYEERDGRYASLLYFWGTPEAMKAHAGTIQQILASARPYKKTSFRMR